MFVCRWIFPFDDVFPENNDRTPKAMTAHKKNVIGVGIIITVG
jgi:hypothetical protein